MNNKATVSDDYYRKFLTTKDKTEEIAISNQQPTQKQTIINTQDYSQQPQKTDKHDFTSWGATGAAEKIARRAGENQERKKR